MARYFLSQFLLGDWCTGKCKEITITIAIFILNSASFIHLFIIVTHFRFITSGHYYDFGRSNSILCLSYNFICVCELFKCFLVLVLCSLPFTLLYNLMYMYSCIYSYHIELYPRFTKTLFWYQLR